MQHLQRILYADTGLTLTFLVWTIAILFILRRLSMKKNDSLLCSVKICNHVLAMNCNKLLNINCNQQTGTPFVFTDALLNPDFYYNML